MCPTATSIIAIPSPGSTVIDGHAFYMNSNLVNVTIGDNVTAIGEGVFAMCQNLREVKISNSVQTIGIAAFYYSPV